MGQSRIMLLEYAVILTYQYQFKRFINSLKMLSINNIKIYCNLRLPTGCPKNRVSENSKTSDQMPIQRCVKGQGGAHKCRHIGDKCQTPGYGMDVLRTQYYLYFGCSNTCKSEQYYIPKDNFFLGHPVAVDLRNTPKGCPMGPLFQLVI